MHKITIEDEATGNRCEQCFESPVNYPPAALMARILGGFARDIREGLRLVSARADDYLGYIQAIYWLQCQTCGIRSHDTPAARRFRRADWHLYHKLMNKSLGAPDGYHTIRNFQTALRRIDISQPWMWPANAPPAPTLEDLYVALWEHWHTSYPPEEV